MKNTRPIFELSGNTKVENYFGKLVTMHQIMAITDIDLGDGEIVHAGELGGYIESIDNVPERDFWIDKDSNVYGNSYLRGHTPSREDQYMEQPVTPAIKNCMILTALHA